MSSMAIAYGMKKKKKEQPIKGHGRLGVEFDPSQPPREGYPKSAQEQRERLDAEHARVGEMQRRKPELYADGGDVDEQQTLGSIIHYPGSPPPVQKPKGYAMGGDIDEDGDEHGMMAHGGDIIDRVMRKRYSEGGKVANGGDDDLNRMADGDPNNFDDLALRDDLTSTYGDDDNSGDALGNVQEAEDRSDIIARIMRQRSMKQRNPRPA